MPVRAVSTPRHVRSGVLPWPNVSARGNDTPHARFLQTHLYVPLIVLAATLLMIAIAQLDWRVAHAIYSWEGYRWLLRRWFVTETLIHQFGRSLSIAAWLGVLCAWAVSSRRSTLAAWRAPLAYLALSILIATLLVSWVKSWSNMDCPWDIIGLGGTRPYLGLFESRPSGLPHNKCFPAGHASGGYAWMSLYFFFSMARPRWRMYGLGIGVFAGLIFGIGQQLRGAHFLSHDLWTAAICWVSASALYLFFVARAQRRAYEQRWDALLADG